MAFICKVDSPAGPLYLASDGTSITGLWVEGQKYFFSTLDADAREASLLIFDQASNWLTTYFTGNNPGPLPPLAPTGSDFRQAVWKLLLEIPYGQTVTYGDLTQALRAAGRGASNQAVGGAVGHNPISILIPCHRVVGADGSLTGYAGGIQIKERLLRLEGVDMSRFYLPKRGIAL